MIRMIKIKFTNKSVSISTCRHEAKSMFRFERLYSCSILTLVYLLPWGCKCCRSRSQTTLVLEIAHQGLVTYFFIFKRSCCSFCYGLIHNSLTISFHRTESTKTMTVTKTLGPIKKRHLWKVGYGRKKRNNIGWERKSHPLLLLASQPVKNFLSIPFGPLVNYIRHTVETLCVWGNSSDKKTSYH